MKNSIYDFLNRDIKELNIKPIIILGFIFIFIMGLISYRITNNNSYALFTNTVAGSKTITIHLDPPKTVTFDPDGGTIPAGTKWTGSGNSATKEVTKGLKYGELPEPTKEGYTFKGWNGKNLFQDSDLVESTKWSPNQNVTVSKTSDYVQVLYNQNTSTPGYIYREANTIFESGKTYTVSIYAKGVNSDSLSIFVYGNTLSAATLSDSFAVNSSTFTYTEQSSNNTYLLLFRSGPTIGTGFQIKWMMVEEGSTATEYEPYYITEDTKVVQTTNHTLKAIWEENETQPEP